MKFLAVHENLNVLDLEKSLDFYREALGLLVRRRIAPTHGSFEIAFLSDGESGFELELTWLKDRNEPYDLGDNEFHLAFRTDDFEAAYKKHGEMGCICYENPEMGIYFISDPDGYWLEIIPSNV
jgi:lactoylglutathione lyase